MKTARGGVFILCIALAASACGGKSNENTTIVDTTTGGTSATAGSANIGGSASIAGNGGSNNGGSAGATSTTCPSAAPAQGSACNYVGAGFCTYPVGMCGSSLFQCVNGRWLQSAPSDGAAYTCLNYQNGDLPMPQDGDSCLCGGTLDCSFNQCDSTGQVHAVCDNTSWHVTTTPCADKPCGTNGLNCKVGEVCVLTDELQRIYTCEHDPCADQSETSSCACAGSLCSSFETCNFVNGAVACVCPTC
jgi:hypothetical protein